MPDFRRRTCQCCQGSDDEVGAISWRGLCVTCAKQRSADNLDQLVAHSGPYFQNYRRACVAAFGGVLVDDLETRS